MSCSINRMVSSPLSSRSVLTMRALSSGPIPAMGSSSRSMRGLVASAIAISSWRCSPWLSLETMTSPRPASPTRASAARAGSRNSSSRRAARQKRKEWPAWACTASATLSSAVKSRNSEVIWNERAKPSWLRRSTVSAVTSLPSKWMRPASGAISPASWAMSVVLPAPFGPITACSSPFGTASEIASDAITPPKRLLRPSICNSASATVDSGDQTIDAAAREQHHQQEQRTKDDLPVFGNARERFFQHQQRQRADHRPEHRAHAAEHRHDDEVARAGPVHERRADEVGMVGEQRSGKPAQHAREDETEQLVAVGGKPDRPHAPLVGSRALNHHAEAGMHEPPDQVDRRQQQRETKIVEGGLVGEIDDRAELAAFVDGHAVVAAISVESDRDVIDHLREGQRDHDEIDAARAQRQRADREREQRRGRDRQRPLQKAGIHPLLGKNAYRVAADSEIGGVTEAHHAAEPHDQVQAHRRDRQNDDAGKERHYERVAGRRGVERHQCQDRDHPCDESIARIQLHAHRCAAGNRPSGRKTSTAAISV